MNKNMRAISREIRQKRVRKKVRGTEARPRLSVFRSAAHIYAQVINDENGRTLAASSTLDKSVKERLGGLKKLEAAKVVGKAVAELAKSRGIETVVFDRNGFLYHGRVKALSEGAREGGLIF
ncbi:MAG: 50S ribosomal protein L18 [Deltaproteobacteria bacterium]|jgi:large subunit ribosomal protein L18|nr:50S ribosomal protein L18 [Deltaproteobacteria bacterium]